MKSFLFSLAFLSIFSCHNSNTALSGVDLADIGYELESSFALDSELKEISGLSFTSYDDLLAVNDELGKIYYLAKSDGDIEQDVRFGRKGDYEGIAVVGNRAYVITSDGQLTLFDLEEGESKKLSTPLSEAFDVEGLAYDQGNNQLLIACKRQAVKNKLFSTDRAIYGFNLKSNTLTAEPTVLFNGKEMTKLLGDKKSRFFPSGIAIHPENSQLYILSAVGSKLMIAEQDGEITAMVDLDKDKLVQPEGIAFDSKNNLWIASEGKSKKARLLMYKPI